MSTRHTAAESEAVPINIMVKPAGSRCNLNCNYCYFLGKKALLSPCGREQMSLPMLECFISQYLRQPHGRTVTFYWQGGEPTLSKLDFYQQAVTLQQKYRPAGVTIANHFQTNGVLLDERWCRFLHQHRFLVGLSIDGPRSLHDIYRRNRAGQGSFDAAMRAVELLRRYQVEFTTLTAVNNRNAARPNEVYRFLRDEIRSPLMQFIPVVEPVGFNTCAPAEGIAGKPQVEPWSVSGDAWGNFLCALFDNWYQHDLGRVFVHYFEAALQIWLGYPSPMCTLAPRCGTNLALNYDGSLYSCDHYVYPRHLLGNIQRSALARLAQSPSQLRFGRDKTDALGLRCRQCSYRFACHGDCPKNRLLQDKDGAAISYLCSGWLRFWRHIDPYLHQIAARLGRQVPARG
ncbi:anaerobic sulfatase maturase [Brenneria populi subsp. brevivirga]|uniref:anaerobic sulfatase maturase n=1 Tax=Brenneria populi TaxID=1505588 RepID=UPI002E173CAA|nr:anaerobic sulfatase maturase [Brenneria populi subsp. brevivirga]